jgi:hypothetical protein
MALHWSWLFALFCLFLWSNLCADAQQRQLFVTHYGKFSGFSYGTQQIFYFIALVVYFVPSMFGYQTTLSLVFEVLSLLYFAAVELLFWVKQNFRWASVLQVTAVVLLIAGVVYECIQGPQDSHYKAAYVVMRAPLVLYFLFYAVSIQTYHQNYGTDKPKFYREHGRFSDYNTQHINANAIFAPSDFIVPKADLFGKPVKIHT